MNFVDLVHEKHEKHEKQIRFNTATRRTLRNSKNVSKAFAVSPCLKRLLSFFRAFRVFRGQIYLRRQCLGDDFQYILRQFLGFRNAQQRCLHVRLQILRIFFPSIHATCQTRCDLWIEFI